MTEASGPAVANGGSTAQAPMAPVMHRVVRRHQDLEDTVSLWLEPVDQPLPRPMAGQFMMLWAFGIGEAPISLAGNEDGLLVHTIRSVGAVTEALCSAAEGSEIGVRGPFGTGWGLAEAEGQPVVIVAGGLGLAPVRPIVTEILSSRGRFEEVTLLVGARSPETLLYEDELAQWRRQGSIDVGVTVDSATPSWRGHVGVVTSLIEHTPAATGTRAFVCGPEVMMRFTARALIDRGLDPDAIAVSLERNMHCAIGHCGHCQLGPAFVCKDGPVLAWSRVEPLLKVRER